MKAITVVFQIIVILALLMFVNGCSLNANISTGNIEQDKKLAMSEIQLFHERMNGEQYAVIFEQANANAKTMHDKESLINALQDVRKQFGKFKIIKDSRVKVFTNQAPVEIKAACVSEYDNTTTTETFIFAKEGSQVKLIKYNIFEGAVNLDEVKTLQ